MTILTTRWERNNFLLKKRERERERERNNTPLNIYTTSQIILNIVCFTFNQKKRGIQSEIAVFFLFLFKSIAVNDKQRFDNLILIRSFLYFDPVFSLLLFANAEDWKKKVEFRAMLDSPKECKQPWLASNFPDYILLSLCHAHSSCTHQKELQHHINYSSSPILFQLVMHVLMCW